MANCWELIPDGVYKKLDAAALRTAQGKRGKFARATNDDFIQVIQANINKVDAAIAKLTAPGQAAALAPAPEVTVEPITTRLLTDREKAAEAWDNVALTVDGAPTFDQLSEERQDTWVGYGEANWSAADVMHEMKAVDAESSPRAQARAGAQMSKAPATVASQAAQVLSEIKSMMRIGALSSRVSVVQSVKDLPVGVQQSVNPDALTQGFVYQGKAYLVADNIAPGKARSVFLHEVGAHLGLENLLGKAQYAALVAKVKQWASKNDGSLESRVAKAATQRVKDAETAANQSDSELVAYFIEEAVDAGVNPTAMDAKTEVGRWLQRVWAALKQAVVKLGLNPDKLTARDVVDMAYGAAHIEASSGAASKVGEVLGRGAQFSKLVESLKAYLQRSGRTLLNVNPQSRLDEHMQLAVQAIESSFPEIEREVVNAKRKAPQGMKGEVLQDFIRKHVTRELGGVPIGPTPHTLAMLGAPMQMVRMDAGVIYKVFMAKHGAEMESVTPEQLVQAIYQPVMVLKTGTSKQFDLVLGIRGAEGPLLVAIENNTDLDREQGGKVAAVKTVYGKEVLGAPDSIGDRIKRGDLVYADTGMSLETPKASRGPNDGHDAYKGKPDVATGVKASNALPSRVSKLQSVLGNASHALMPKIKAGMVREKFKAHAPTRTDMDLASYIGNNYKASSSKDGWADAPSFSKAPTSSAAAARKTLGTQATDAARRAGGASAASVVSDVSHVFKRLVSSMRFLPDLVGSVSKSIPAAAEWYAAMQKLGARRRKLGEAAEKIAVRALALDKAVKGGTARINKFIADSTFNQTWGYKPEFLTDTDNGDGTTTPWGKIDPGMAARWKEMTTEEKSVVEAVFQHGNDMAVKRQEMLMALGLSGKFGMSMTKLKGPYAPLMRFGRNVAVLKSQSLLDAEAALASSDGTDTKTLQARVDSMMSDGQHYVVRSFDTLGQAKEFAFAGDAANGGAFAHTDAWPAGPRQETQRTMPQDVVSKIMGAIKAANVAPAEREKVLDMVNNIWLQAQDEGSARQHLSTRNNRAGFDEDMMRAFLTHAKAEAAFLSNMELSGDVNDAFGRMREQRKNDQGKHVNAEDFNAMASHHAAMWDYRETPIQDGITSMTSAMQLATSIGYHVTNATQGFMVSLPKLAADFNDYNGAWRHMMAGYGLVRTAGIGTKFDLSKVADVDVRDALQDAMNNGVLDIGQDNDFTAFNRPHTGIAVVDSMGAGAAKALNLLRNVSRGVETVNRVSTGYAAYKMARAHGKTHEQAKAYTLRVLQDTQGDFTNVGSPLAFKRLPKVIMQYKKFQFMMGALYVKAFHQAFMGTTAEEKALGRRMLMFKLFHTSMAAGALGLPMMNLAAMVFSMFGGTDEPEDLERWMRDQMGNSTLANGLLHGPLSMLGLDMSAKLGDDKIFSIMPYGEWDFSSAEGLRKTAASLVGPGFAQGSKMAEGVYFFGKGEFTKGVEQVMPSGATNAIRAWRVANEGFTLKNGDVMFKPEDINAAALVMDAVGLPSAEMKRMQWVRGQQYEIDAFFKERSNAIKLEYMNAVKAGDPTGEIIQDWMALQNGKDRVRPFFNDASKALPRQQLSTLTKYPQTVGKRAADLQAQVPEEQ